MAKDDELDLDNTAPLRGIKLDFDTVKSKIPSYTSQKLCEMIVCERYIGFYPEISVLCMEELAKRRDAGDIFEFEDYIEKAHKTLPKLDFTVPDLRSVMNTLVSAAQKAKK
jgi:hypothetical protein